jgi:Asp-tRNA(Asn)/Glu-tRNA(Gln) amidotransferase A subunit family amidase
LSPFSEPESDDFKQVTEVFERALAELRDSGAELVDPIEIPRLNELLAKRAANPNSGDRAFKLYFGRSQKPPFSSRAEAMASPRFQNVARGAQNRLRSASNGDKHYDYLLAREELLTNVLKIMADQAST